MPNLKTTIPCALCGAAMLLGSASAGAAPLYATSVEGGQIVSVDISTNTVTTVAAIGAADSLVFDSSGRIIYTAIWAGQVRRYNPATLADELLAGGFNIPADLVLEPGGNSVLVSEYSGGRIDRIDLNTLAVSTLAAPGGNPEGLAYDSTGRLFANLGVRTWGADKYVAQINPVSGAVIATSPLLSSLDGLTYDSVTGKLFASSLYGNGFYEFDPNNLASVTAHKMGLIPLPDGITSDGAGNLFLAARGDFRIYKYNIAGDTLTQHTYVFGLDDLAPASGLGSHIPEPAPLALVAGGLALLGWTRRKTGKGLNLPGR